MLRHVAAYHLSGISRHGNHCMHFWISYESFDISFDKKNKMIERKKVRYLGMSCILPGMYFDTFSSNSIDGTIK